jgi:hypothetical protein
VAESHAKDLFLVEPDSTCGLLFKRWVSVTVSFQTTQMPHSRAGDQIFASTRNEILVDVRCSVGGYDLHASPAFGEEVEGQRGYSEDEN